jgi:hypothetical protein
LNISGLNFAALDFAEVRPQLIHQLRNTMFKIAPRLLISLIIGFSALTASTTTVAGVVYTANFSAAGSGGALPSLPGWYYYLGHEASQTFATGLSSVTDFSWNAHLDYNSLSQPLVMTFSLNGSNVGNTTFLTGQLDYAINFSFADIPTNAGDITLRMFVTTEACTGCGSISFLSENMVSMTQSESGVPEPASIALFGLGLLAIGAARRAK